MTLQVAQSSARTFEPAAVAAPVQLSADFRGAMRRLAATVSIVTTRADGIPFGMTATSVSSLSAEPPSLLICVNRSASLHGGMNGSSRFCINILGVEHAELCKAFAGKLAGADRFGMGDWEDSEDEIPFLASAQANIFCRLDGRTDYGTHTIFIGLVEQVRLSGEPSPLVYQDGRFGKVSLLDS